MRGRLDAGPVVLIEHEDARSERLPGVDATPAKANVQPFDVGAASAHSLRGPGLVAGGRVRGPIPVARELTGRLAGRGHAVEVVTTTIVDLRRAAPRTRVETVDGIPIHYLGTPLRYRWMGITPTLPAALERLERPDVVHVLGFRDVVTTATAAWARLRRIPYILEPLGMFRPRLRKVALKRALDASLYRGVPGGAAAIVAASRRELDDVVAGGVPPERVRVRGNGFPEPFAPAPADRAGLGIPEGAPIVLYVGRIASGKGIEHLVAAVQRIPRGARSPRRARRPARCAGRARRSRARAAADAGAAARSLRPRGRPRAALRGRELRHGRRGGRPRPAHPSSSPTAAASPMPSPTARRS